MSNIPSTEQLREIVFKRGKNTVTVFGFCIEDDQKQIVIASTFGNQGYFDITEIRKSAVIQVKKLALK
jgi:hypothetical protein